MLTTFVLFGTLIVGDPKPGLTLHLVKVQQEHTTIRISANLKNTSQKALTIWDPLNYESRDSVRFLIRDSKGKEFDITPPPIPRSTGVATGRTISPKESIALPTMEIPFTRPETSVGKLWLILVYRNSITERNAVKGVWTGEIRSKPWAL